MKEVNTIVKGVRVWDRYGKEWLTVDVDLRVDIYSLSSQLAQKAIRNKSRKARDAHGAIVLSLRS